MTTPNTPNPSCAKPIIDVDTALNDLDGIASMLFALAAAAGDGMSAEENTLFALGRFLRLIQKDLLAAGLPSFVEREAA